MNCLILLSLSMAMFGQGIDANTHAQVSCDARYFLEQAIGSAREIKGVEKRIAVLQVIASAYAKAGDHQTAAGILAQCARMARSLQDRDGVLFWIVMAQNELGDFKGALETVERMASGSRDGARMQIGLSVASAGQYQRAREIAKTLKDEFYRNAIFEEIAYTQAKSGKLDAALQTVADFEDERAAPAAGARILIVELLTESGNIGDAIRVARLIKTPGVKLNALRKIATAQLDAGDRAAARITFEQARQLAKDENESSPFLVVLEARLRDIDGAVAAAKAFIDRSERNDTLRQIATVQARNGRFEEALKLLRLTEADMEMEFALKDIAIIQAKAGDIRGALKMLECARDHYVLSTSLERIARLQFKACDCQGGRASLLRAVEAAKSVEVGGGTKVIVLRKIATAQAETGDLNQARITFRQSLQATRVYKDEDYRASLGMEIARAQAKTCLTEEAVHWSCRSSSPIIRAYAFVGVASGILDRKHKVVKGAR